jgi:hypothetical protein
MDNKTVVMPRPAKSPSAAALLSIFIPFGAGALYNEQKNKALTHFFIFLGLVYALTRGGSGVVFGLGIAAFYFYQIFDNVQSARAINRAAASQESSAVAVPENLGAGESGSIFWGLFLIALGALLILANFEIITYSVLLNFWPVAVIVVGLKLVYDSVAKSKKGN